ncbi:MAG: LacI family DNA-binding transcriptional regulator [Burkholderiaceae bacterium]
MSSADPDTDLADPGRVGAARLADVARDAGVSLATASRALSSPDLVRDETRKKVQAAVDRLGYVPHGAARALASQRTRTIGAVFPPLENPIFATGTHVLAQTLEAHDYTLLLATHDNDLDAELSAARRLIERGVDGLVLVGLEHRPALFALLESSRVPFECTWSSDPDGAMHSVGIDHRKASATVTRHLLALGHREFAVIAGQTDRNDRAAARLRGVHDALAEHGIRLPGRRIIEAPFSLLQGREAMRRLLAEAPGFTALIAGNDPLAIGAMIECAQRSIIVPEQLSVVGFDDIELSGQWDPPLTTMRIPSARIGLEAARRLMARLAGEPVPVAQTLPCELIVRGSTAPALGRV